MTVEDVIGKDKLGNLIVRCSCERLYNRVAAAGCETGNHGTPNGIAHPELVKIAAAYIEHGQVKLP